MGLQVEILCNKGCDSNNVLKKGRSKNIGLSR